MCSDLLENCGLNLADFKPDLEFHRFKYSDLNIFPPRTFGGKQNKWLGFVWISGHFQAGITKIDTMISISMGTVSLNSNWNDALCVLFVCLFTCCFPHSIINKQLRFFPAPELWPLKSRTICERKWTQINSQPYQMNVASAFITVNDATIPVFLCVWFFSLSFNNWPYN